MIFCRFFIFLSWELFLKESAVVPLFFRCALWIRVDNVIRYNQLVLPPYFVSFAIFYLSLVRGMVEFPFFQNILFWLCYYSFYPVPSIFCYMLPNAPSLVMWWRCHSYAFSLRNLLPSRFLGWKWGLSVNGTWGFVLSWNSYQNTVCMDSTFVSVDWKGSKIFFKIRARISCFLKCTCFCQMMLD